MNMKNIVVFAIAVVIIASSCFGFLGCKAKKPEVTINEPKAESSDKSIDSDLSQDNANVPKVSDFVWKVEPTLEYGSIYYCVCGYFGVDDADSQAVNTKTGFIEESEHYGHGFGVTNYLYDESKNLFGHYTWDEGGEVYEMMSAGEFISNVWGAERIKAFQKIDSDKVTKYKNDWDGDSYDLSSANVSEKYAVANVITFVSDFIYDYSNEAGGWNFSNYNANNIITLVLDGKWGILDKEGKTVVPFCFEHIVLIDEKTAFAKIDGKYGILYIYGQPLEEDEIYPYGGEVFVTNFSDKNIFIRSEPVINGESSNMNDGNKIGWIEKGDVSVELIATGNEYHEGGDGHWWYEVEIPQWYRDTPEQAENFAGKPFIGWVREDIVRQLR
jgi:hypothetical protein